jgi:hypothetical protein
MIGHYEFAVLLLLLPNLYTDLSAANILKLAQ